MVYMGSKSRIAKEILPIMLKDREPNQYWVEPFVGGANMIDKVDGLRIGADLNKYAIEALIDIRDNVELLPKNNKEFTEDMYKKLKESDEYVHKGYASFVFSFGAKFLGGWAKNKEGRDYVAKGYKNAVKQSPLLQGVELIHCSYIELNIPPKSIIYCDIPYQGTTKYKEEFNHQEFWQWCRDMSKKGHKVFISEYDAPEDFECIWQKEILSSFHHNRIEDTTFKKGVEKLFIYKN